MNSNQLSFSITMKNNASPALNSLKKQITSLKSGIASLNSSTSSTSSYVNSLTSGSRSSTSALSSLKNALSSVSRTTKSVASGVTSFGRGLGSIATGTVKTFTSGISNAAKKVTNFGSRITQALGTFAVFKVAGAALNTITSAFDRAIQRADTMDLFSDKMTMITNSAELADEALEHMKTTTKGTPYALDIAAKAVQNFVTRGMDTRKAAESVDIWMDAVSAYGNGSNEQFESVMDALAKMRTKGTVEMRYLNRLFAAGINPVRMYAQATGMAQDEVQTALSDKVIGTEEFLDVVEKAMREGTGGVIQIQGMAKKLATTWAATTANMQAAIARGLVNFLDGLDSVAQLFNENGLKGLVKAFGDTSEVVLTDLATKITDVVNRGKELNETLKANAGENYTTTIETINSNREAGSQAGTNFKEITKQSFTDNFTPYLDGIYQRLLNIRVAWSGVVAIFQQGLEAISGSLGTFLGQYLGLSISGMEDLATQFLVWSGTKIPEWFGKVQQFLDYMNNNAEKVVNGLKGIVGEFKAWEQILVPPVMDKFNQFMDYLGANKEVINATLKDGYNRFKQWVALRYPPFLDKLTAFITWLWKNRNYFTTPVKFFAGEIKALYNFAVPPIINTLKQFFDWLPQHKNEFLDPLKQFYQSIKDWGSAHLPGFFEELKGYVIWLWNNREYMAAPFKDIFNTLKGFAQVVFPVVLNDFKSIMGWIIEHWDGVVKGAAAMLTAFLGFKALDTVRESIARFNDAILALNQVLSMLTFGKVQLPTLGDMGQENAMRKRLVELQEELALEKERLKYEREYNRERSKVITSRNRDLERIDNRTATKLTGADTSFDKRQTSIDNTYQEKLNKITERFEPQYANVDYNEGQALDRLAERYDLKRQRIEDKLNNRIRSSARAQKATKLQELPEDAFTPTKEEDYLRNFIKERVGTDIPANLGDGQLFYNYGSYQGRKTMSADEVKANRKLYDDVYEEMKKIGYKGGNTNSFSDLYNYYEEYYKELDALNAAQELDLDKLSEKYDYKRQTISGREDLARGAAQRIYDRDTDLNKENRLKTRRETLTDSYNKRKGIGKNAIDRLDELDNMYDAGQAILKGEKVEEPGRLSKFWQGYKDFFFNKNRTKEEPPVQIIPPAFDDVTEKIDTKPSKLATKLGQAKEGTKDLFTGFFGTMFSGMKDLGSDEDWSYKKTGNEIRDTVDNLKRGFTKQVIKEQGLDGLTEMDAQKLVQYANSMIDDPFKTHEETKGNLFSNLFGKNDTGQKGGFFSNLFKPKEIAESATAIEGVETAVEGAGAAIAEAGTATAPLSGIFSSVSSAVSGAVSFIGSFLTTLAGITGVVAIATAAIGLIGGALGYLNPNNELSNGINEFFANFKNKVVDFATNASTMITNFIQNFTANLPQLIPQGANLVLSIVMGIITSIPKLLTAGVELIGNLLITLLDEGPKLVYAGLEFIGELLAGFIRGLPEFFQNVKEFLVKFREKVGEILPHMLAFGVNVIIAIAKGLWSVGGKIVQALGDIFRSAIDYIRSGQILKDVADLATSFFNGFVKGLYDVADQWNMGWLLDKMGLQRPKEEIKTAAEETQQAIDDTSFNWDNFYDSWNPDLPTDTGLSTEDIISKYGLTNGALNSQTFTNEEMASMGVTSGVLDWLSAAGKIEQDGTVTANALNDILQQISQTEGNFEKLGITNDALRNIELGIGNKTSFAVDTSWVDDYITGGEIVANRFQDIELPTGPKAYFNHLKEGWTTQDLPEYGSNRELQVGTLTPAIDMAEQAQDLGADTTNNYALGFMDNSTKVSKAIDKVGDKSLGQYEDIATDRSIKKNTVNIATVIVNTLKQQLKVLTKIMQQTANNATDSFTKSFNKNSRTVKKAIDKDFVGPIQKTAKQLTGIDIDTDYNVTSNHREFTGTVTTSFDEIKNSFITLTDEAAYSFGYNTDLITNKMSEYIYTWIPLFNEAVTNSKEQFVTDTAEMAQAEQVNLDVMAQALDFFTSTNLPAFVTSITGAKQTIIEQITAVTEQTGVSLTLVTELLNAFATGTLPAFVLRIVSTKDEIIANLIETTQQTGMNVALVVNILANFASVILPAFVSVVDSHVNTLMALNATYKADMAVTVDTITQLLGVLATNFHNTLLNVEGCVSGHFDAITQTDLDYIDHLTNFCNAIVTAYVNLGNNLDRVLSSISLKQYYWGMDIIGNFERGLEAGLDLLSHNLPQHLDGVVNPFSGIYDAISGSAGSLFNGMADSFSDFGSGVMDFLNTPLNVLSPVESLQSVGNTLAGDAQALAQGAISLPEDIYNPLFKSLGDEVIGTVTDIGSIFGFDVGTRYVPKDMLAMVHEGEAIFPADQNPYTQSGGDYLSDIYGTIFGENAPSLGTQAAPQQNTNNTNNNNIVFNVDVHKDADGDRFIGNLETELHRIFTEGRRIGSAV